MPVPANPILDVVDGLGQVKSTVLYFVLDKDLTLTGGQVHPLERPTLSATTSGSVKRRLSNFSLEEREVRALDLFGQRIMPTMVLEDGTMWPMGVYLFTNSAKNVGTYASTFDTVLMDQDYILTQKTRTPYGVNPGGSIVQAINEILDAAHIYNRNIPTGANKKIADPTVWPPDTSRMDMLTVLCNLAGWLPPYFDNRGICVIRPPSDPNNSDPDHLYDSNRMKDIVEDDNLLNAFNVYQVIGTGPTKGEISASIEVDPTVPYSVPNRGFEVVDTYRTQGITSSQQAQEMVNARALAGSAGFKVVSFVGTPDPRHSLFDTIEFNGKIYTETDWSLTLGGVDHSHSMTIGGFKVETNP